MTNLATVFQNIWDCLKRWVRKFYVALARFIKVVVDTIAPYYPRHEAIRMMIVARRIRRRALRLQLE